MDRATIWGTNRYEMQQHFGVPRTANIPQGHICCATVSMEPVVPPERDLLLHRRGGTRRALGNEDAERQHLANLALLVKDIISFSCLFLPPFCKRLLPPQHKPGEGSALLALPTRAAQAGAAASSHPRAPRTPKCADPHPWRLEVLSCPCQH